MQVDSKIYEIIIIGAGPTGLYGAFFAGLKKIETLILEVNSTYGGAPARLYPEKPLYDIPGIISITGAELVNNMYKQLESQNHWSIKYNTEIVEIVKCDEISDELIYKIIDKNNNEYFTKNIIFATGYGAFEFVSFDEEIKKDPDAKISYYVNKLDYYSDKDVVICGGGDSAIDFANALKNKSKSLNLIHRRNEFRAKQANVDKILNHVSLHLNKTVYEIKKDTIHFYDNDTNEKMFINFDELLVLFGTKLVSSNIKIENLYNNVHKIEVNPITLESINYQNIFACGLSNQIKSEQTIITGINDIIKVVGMIAKRKKQ